MHNNDKEIYQKWKKIIILLIIKNVFTKNKWKLQNSGKRNLNLVLQSFLQSNKAILQGMAS